MVAWLMVVAHLILTAELLQKPLRDLLPVQHWLLPGPQAAGGPGGRAGRSVTCAAHRWAGPAGLRAAAEKGGMVF